MTGSHASADDLTQETCLKAFRSLEQFERCTNYRAWLFKILVNHCRDYQRREARAPFKYWDAQEVESVLAKSHDKVNQPDMQLQQSVFYTHALEAMARLPPDIRIVVSLSLLDGMSYQEISEVVGIPLGTVRSRLSRGQKKTSRCFENSCKRKQCPLYRSAPRTIWISRRETNTENII